MDWVKGENKLFRVEDAIGFEYSAGDDQKPAALTVYLRGGSALKFEDKEAERIWQRFIVKAGNQAFDATKDE